MRLEDVKTVGLLGGGVMGGGIGQIMATAGYQVVIRDLTDEVIERSRHVILETKFGLKQGVARGKVKAEELDDIIARLSFTTRLEDLAGADVLIEAIPENLELKQKTFAELDALIKPEAIFASNTSGFCIKDLARDVSEQRKALFCGMHFASPVPAMKMCEVITTPESSQDTIDTIVGLAERSGRVVSMVKDAPGTYGFILNRVFAAARREADKIVADGLATREDVDKAMINGRNWPVGFYGSRGARTGWIDE